MSLIMDLPKTVHCWHHRMILFCLLFIIKSQDSLSTTVGRPQSSSGFPAANARRTVPQQPLVRDISTIVDHAHLSLLAYFPIHDVVKSLTKSKHNVRVTQRRLEDVGACYSIIQYTDDCGETQRIITVAGSRNPKNMQQNADRVLDSDDFINMRFPSAKGSYHRGYLSVYRAIIRDFLNEERRVADRAIATNGNNNSNSNSNRNSNSTSNSTSNNTSSSSITSSTSITSITRSTSSTSSTSTSLTDGNGGITSYTATSSRNLSAVPPALTKCIAITGHSLGGAVSCLLALGLKGHGYNVKQVTIFGAPKFTNKKGSEQIAQSGLSIARFEHVLDPAVFSPVNLPQPEKIALGLTLGRNILGGIAGSVVGSLAGIAMTDVYADLHENTLVLLEPIPLTPPSPPTPTPPSPSPSPSSDTSPVSPPVPSIGGALGLLIGGRAASGDGRVRGPHRFYIGRASTSRSQMISRLLDLPSVDWKWHSMHGYYELLVQYKEKYVVQQNAQKAKDDIEGSARSSSV